MLTSTAPQDYALAIYASDPKQVAPVVYDLSSASIDIGSAEDNNIVLKGPGVEPYHLAVRQVGSQLCALVDVNVARQQGESFWLETRSDDSFYCPEHGSLPKLQEIGRCPLCRVQARTLWLLRPLQPGDIFSIGQSFKATVLSQRRPNHVADGEAIQPAAPWPDVHWLENPPRLPAILVGSDEHTVVSRAFPFDDSNLWVWDPGESPFPVFIHQRANRCITVHARSSLNREVGGLLLGNIYHDPPSELLYPVISHAIAARYATEARGHLTFTRQSWLDLIEQREKHYPDTIVVGWYHTHPGLGIFLSEWDLTIHRHFFRQPWQVAMVADPQQGNAGFFVWSDAGVLDPQEPHLLFRLVEPDDEANGQRPTTRVRIKLGGPIT